jgi:hypothetical protein
LLNHVSSIKNLYRAIFSKLPIFVSGIIIRWISTMRIWTLDTSLCVTYAQNLVHFFLNLTPHVDKIVAYDLCILLRVFKYFPKDMNFLIQEKTSNRKGHSTSASLGSKDALDQFTFWNVTVTSLIQIQRTNDSG